MPSAGPMPSNAPPVPSRGPAPSDGPPFTRGFLTAEDGRADVYINPSGACLALHATVPSAFATSSGQILFPGGFIHDFTPSIISQPLPFSSLSLTVPRHCLDLTASQRAALSAGLTTTVLSGTLAGSPASYSAPNELVLGTGRALLRSPAGIPAGGGGSGWGSSSRRLCMEFETTEAPKAVAVRGPAEFDADDVPVAAGAVMARLTAMPEYDAVRGLWAMERCYPASRVVADLLTAGTAYVEVVTETGEERFGRIFAQEFADASA